MRMSYFDQAQIKSYSADKNPWNKTDPIGFWTHLEKSFKQECDWEGHGPIGNQTKYKWNSRILVTT